MAKIFFRSQGDYFEKLKQMQEHFSSDEPIRRAVYAGADPVANEIRRRIEALPEESFRYLGPNEWFVGISPDQKQDLLNSFGLSKIRRSGAGLVSTKAGFDGYGSFPTAAYPNGLPNALLARSIESGSSVRKKIPFVDPAVKATQEESIDAMGKSIEDDFKKIF